MEHTRLKWCLALAVVVCFAVTYSLFLQHEVPSLLASIATIRARRYEPRIALLLLSTMAVAVPLAIIPSGSVMIAAAAIGYIYGLRGILLAWPGFSLGLAVSFLLGRAFAGFGSSQNAEALLSGDVDPESTSVGRTSPVPLFGGTTALAFIRGTRRLLREQPKRTAILVTFATHSPATQFILGWATSLKWTDSILACAVDGVKVLAPLVKGMLIGDLMQITNMDSTQSSCLGSGIYCSGLWLKIVVSVAFFVIFVLVGRSVVTELRDMEESGEALTKQKPSVKSTPVAWDVGPHRPL